MTDQTTEPDPGLAVECPYTGGCGAPAGTPCYGSYGTHADRLRLAELRTLEHGACALCGRFMVRGTVEGVHDSWHPDPADHGCPPLPDPATDWNGYALAAQQGLTPGHPGAEHFVSTTAIADAAAIQVHGSGYDDDALNAQIERFHGPGAVDALEAAFADGSIFAEDLPHPVAVEVGIICPECDNGKHVNCDGVGMHPVTDELQPCACTHPGMPS